MHTQKSGDFSRSGPASAVVFLLREAKKLHKAARSDSLAQALPVLRRLISSNTFRGLSLPDLHRRRAIVQRKHILCMLALEAGYDCWAEYRTAISGLSTDEVVHFDIVRKDMGYPNLWFSSSAEADAYSAEHGGRVVSVGRQAVVIVDARANAR
ncbi:MAG: hypothetical protein GC138_05970 [Gammaproteobacteria bacterium]|nr:hypothetical protein [Gammaproteobacteria bacterium]